MLQDGVPVLGTGLYLAMIGDQPALAARLASGWQPTTTDRYGSTALMWAAGGGHVQLAAWLLDSHGAQVNAGMLPHRLRSYALQDLY